MTDIANYDIKHMNNMKRLDALKENKWEQIKTIKKALSNRPNQDNIILSSLLNVYSMELNIELSETLKLIDVLYRVYTKNEHLLNATVDKILAYNLTRDMNIIKEEIDKLNQTVVKLTKYKI